MSRRKNHPGGTGLRPVVVGVPPTTGVTTSDGGEHPENSRISAHGEIWRDAKFIPAGRRFHPN